MQARASVIKVEPLTSASGKPYARVNLAENFGKGEDRRTTYYNGVVFKESLIALLKKGQLIEFKGILTTKAFTRQDGTLGTENKVEIFALTVEFEAKEQPANAGANAASAAKPAAAQPTPATPGAPSEEEALYAHHSAMVDDPAMDIPF